MGWPSKGPTKKQLGLPVGMGYGMQMSHLEGARWENVERLARSMHINLEEKRKDAWDEEMYRSMVRQHIYKILKREWERRWPKR